MKQDHVIRLASGRELYPYEGFISINADLNVRHGYDGLLDGLDELERDGTWTPAERHELADRMIALWQRFKQAP
jgi:hypothetical protein